MIGKKLHRDMAEVNVYTARRLREMACSLSGLARAFTEEAGSDKRLSFDEGLAAMQTAAFLVGGAASRLPWCAEAAAAATCMKREKRKAAITCIICFAPLSRRERWTKRTCPACFMNPAAGRRSI